ncbi:MAG: hypothetical protein U0231_19945 [Nitrospiraceae bacterium]
MIRFGRCGKDRPKADVVRRGACRRHDLLRVMGGQTDQLAWTDELTGLLHREIVLTHVHPIGIDRDREVAPVVND